MRLHQAAADGHMASGRKGSSLPWTGTVQSRPSRGAVPRTRDICQRTPESNLTVTVVNSLGCTSNEIG
jgi:hypothetical protein